MNKELKKETITLGELKKIRVYMSSKWLKDLTRRYADKHLVKINFKDLINKIGKQYDNNNPISNN